MIKLGDICNILNGRNQKKVEDINGKYPIYGSGGIMGYANDYICKAGTTIIGRKGSINKPLYVNTEFWNVDTAFGLQPKECCHSRFLYYICKSIDFTRYDKGVTIPSLVKSDLLQIPIDIPSFEKQSQIVEELDQLSNIIEKQRQQLSELDNLAQSIFYDMFGDPVTNEKGWDVKKLKDIAISQIGLTYKPDNVSENGTIVLRSSNIQDSSLDFADIVRVNCNIKEKQYVQEGDILMCSRNGSFRLVGKVARIKNLRERMSYGAFMTIIRSNYQDYLFAFFKSPAFREQLISAQTATINQITVKMLDEIILPLPPMELQQLFAQKIEAIEQEKEIIKQSIAETEELFNSRMDYYFG